MTSVLPPLSDGLPESWAVEWGEDRFGVFAGFAVGGVVQRMRWVPPGTFRMGSPEEEAGRFRFEEPQREVRLSRGYWLADTPCTQALWQVVVGSNPSLFVHPERPVERVSWEDCQVFLGSLERLVSGLKARLPSEAEWKYACRAGTTSATWVGDPNLRGERNVPNLDETAWYGGNSGVRGELEGLEDSSGRAEKQRPRYDADTRPVRQGLPNPRGFFDTSGNVYEWCADWREPYSAEAAVDPMGASAGSLRVICGGSGGGLTKHFHAEYRQAFSPKDRHYLLGFRVAGGQGGVRRPAP